MQPSETKHLFWYQRPVVWIAVGILGCLGFLAMPHAQRVYHRWTGVRKVQRATEALARNDYETAIINARGALATNAEDLEALRIMARTAEAAGSPQALDFRRQIEAIDPSDAENLLGLADASLKAGNIESAEHTLKSVPISAQASTRYHDVAAGIAWGRQDTNTFESHTEQASQLAPSDDNYQLKLATLRLNAKSPELRAGALATLDQLSNKSPTRSAALRALIRDAITGGDLDRALKLANFLATAPDASIGDKLTRLSALHTLWGSDLQSFAAMRGVSKAELYSRLGELQKETTVRPGDLTQVVRWMNEHHMALQVPEWVETLPAEIVSTPPVCAAVAESHALASNWTKLKETLESASWEKLEHLRFAFLSRAFERLGDTGNAATAWNRALETAQPNPASLQQLIAEINSWGWEEKTEEALWKLAAKGQCPRWAAETLWSVASKRNDTSALYKASKLLLQADPKSVSARNNFILLALITQQDETAAHPLAEALYKENSANSTIAPTYALSLFRRGRPSEAVGVLAMLPEAQLREPWIAFYYSLFLTAAGKPDEAEPYLRLTSGVGLFPEVEPIREILNLAFKARQFQRDLQKAESDAAWNAAVASAQPNQEWLELLAKAAIHWGWQDQAGDALIKLSAKGICPEWAIDHLWSACLKRGDSSEIYKAAKLILDTNPNNVTARNNLTASALLAGKEGELPHRIAEQSYRTNPNDADATTTFSLSLHLRGKPEEALAVFQSLKPEQLNAPRTALYRGIALAAMGQADEAERSLQIAASGPLLPEEKSIIEILRAVFEWRALDRTGDQAQSDAAWLKALAAAERRPDTLATLARMLLKSEGSAKATEVLWKLATTTDCPRWVIDRLWTQAEEKRDAAQLYKISRLLRRAELGSVKIRNDYVRLGLLIGEDADFPHRQADTLFDENPGDAQVAATRALSLYQRNKAKEAVAVLAALRPEQLREPRVAYYYGIVLLATGQSAKAQEYLRIGKEGRLLPEEESLLAKVTSASVVNAAR